nr:DNA methyltransferase [Corallococcus exercitus]
MDADARHAYGAHFTSEQDILKVVRPTIVNPWRERIEKAETLKELLDAKRDLGRYRVLDPACGSGNFLYVAFRELKRLETDVLLSIRSSYKGKTAKSVLQGSVSVTQFFGFDVLPFATELAKVTLMLAKELALKEARPLLDDGQGTFDLDTGLPLENLDSNIVCADALLTDWPKVDAIIGNPPYQSKNKAQEELGRDYMGLLDEKFQIPGRADFCVYFFRKAHDEMLPGTRAGLVGTNTIRQNYSRIGGA